MFIGFTQTLLIKVFDSVYAIAESSFRRTGYRTGFEDSMARYSGEFFLEDWMRVEEEYLHFEKTRQTWLRCGGEIPFLNILFAILRLDAGRFRF
jgi:hypothetical protein